MIICNLHQFLQFVMIEVFYRAENLAFINSFVRILFFSEFLLYLDV
jgi:hypothetical protein